MSEPHSPSVDLPVSIDYLNDLLALMRNGDRVAGDAFFRAILPLVARIVPYRVARLEPGLKPHVEAADVEQKVCIALWKSAGHKGLAFPVVLALIAYLTTAVRFQLNDERKYHTAEIRDLHGEAPSLLPALIADPRRRA